MKNNILIYFPIGIALVLFLYELLKRMTKKEKWTTEFSSFLIAVISLCVAVVTLYTAVNINRQIENYEVVDSYPIGWSNSGTPREAYTIEQINNGCLGDRIVFNSISDSNMGHEFNFVAARENTGANAGINNIWCANEIEVKKGKSYLLSLFCHNNSPLGYDAVAENVQIQFEIHNPVYVKENDTEIATFENGYYCVAVHGHIFSSNAVPDLYSDGVKFISENPFHLEYLPGSALFENNGIGANGGFVLDDRIISDWVMIGYDRLDGRVPGCYQFDSYTSIAVVPVFD